MPRAQRIRRAPVVAPYVELTASASELSPDSPREVLCTTEFGAREESRRG